MATRTKYGLFVIGGVDTTPVRPVQAGTYSRHATTDVVTVTATNHGYVKGQEVHFVGTAGTTPPVGEFIITSVPDANTFTFQDADVNTAVSGQTCLIGGGGNLGVAKLPLVGIYDTEALAIAKASVIRAGTDPQFKNRYQNAITLIIPCTQDY